MQKWITDRQLKEKLGGCSDMTIWRLRQAGKLPRPAKFGKRNVTLESEADAAIAALIEHSDDHERGAA
jgi:predicted DNA-binding transcriptional regulator AlpA